MSGKLIYFIELCGKTLEQFYRCSLEIATCSFVFGFMEFFEYFSTDQGQSFGSQV